MLDLDKVKNFTENKKRSRFLTLFYTQLLCLIFMTIGRVVFHICFYQESSFKEKLIAYLYGFIFDLRISTLILLPTILLVLLPMTFTAQNYFARFVVVIQSLFLFAYQLIVAIDFESYYRTKLRINLEIFQIFSEENISLKRLLNDYPIFIVILISIIATLFISIGIEFIKKKNYYKIQYGLIFFPYRLERFFWLVLMLPLLHGSISQECLSSKNLANFSQVEFDLQLALNPLVKVLEDWYSLAAGK